MLKNFFNNSEGSFALKIALMAPVILVLVGAAIDASRLYSARQQLQNSADSSALSAAIAYFENEQEYEEIARNSFDANLNDEFVTLNYDAQKTDQETIFVNATVRLEPLFMQIFGLPRLDATVVSEVNIVDQTVTEVALVVDNSASLIWNGGYTPLSAALDTFMNAVTEQDDMGNLYVSFIPWSGTVNIGAARSSWLHSYNSTIFGPDTWHGCVMARDNGHDLTDRVPTGSGRFDPFAWPSDGVNNWSGQPVEDFLDYGETVSAPILGPNAGCVMEMVPLTNQRNLIMSAIVEYQTHIQTKVGTFTPVALVWGYRALSDKWQGRWGGPTPANIPSTNGNKIIVFLSDGFANWNDVEIASTSHYSPYGYPWENELNIPDPTDEEDVKEELELRFEEVCDNIKAAGIEIYTIGYAMSSGDAAIYEQCATSQSHFYFAPNTNQIDQVFTDIAGKIRDRNIRILK